MTAVNQSLTFLDLPGELRNKFYLPDPLYIDPEDVVDADPEADPDSAALPQTPYPVGFYKPFTVMYSHTGSRDETIWRHEFPSFANCNTQIRNEYLTTIFQTKLYVDCRNLTLPLSGNVQRAVAWSVLNAGSKFSHLSSSTAFELFGSDLMISTTVMALLPSRFASVTTPVACPSMRQGPLTLESFNLCSASRTKQQWPIFV